MYIKYIEELAAKFHSGSSLDLRPLEKIIAPLIRSMNRRRRYPGNPSQTASTNHRLDECAPRNPWHAWLQPRENYHYILPSVSSFSASSVSIMRHIAIPPSIIYRTVTLRSLESFKRFNFNITTRVPSHKQTQTNPNQFDDCYYYYYYYYYYVISECFVKFFCKVFTNE